MLSSIFFVAFTILFVSIPCQANFIRKTRPLSITNFDEIKINGMFDIFLTPLAEHEKANVSVEIETTSEGHNVIFAEIEEGHILSIGVRGILLNTPNSRVYIRFFTPLRRYYVAGMTQTLMEDNAIVNLKNETFILEQEGTANMMMKFNVENFKGLIRGIGTMKFEGEVRQELTLEVNGAPMINAEKLIAKRTIVNTAGTAGVRVMATEDVQITALGMANIMYKLPEGKEPSRIQSFGMSAITRFS